eukprot:TRINITY_DN9351_c0_g3_i1.p1 TRINITY_DN9351_c0_g3~~TRINITY_DN9351_c0_g3_i1.p1  ORF type:complete len:115 (-),score=16.34 TRINITY_DN9351_c0_g3_i1:580-924(-)
MCIRDSYKASNDEAVIPSYDIEEDQDPLPIKAKTARSVSLARNYILCNVIIQCALLALILFFVLIEDWYRLKESLCVSIRAPPSDSSPSTTETTTTCCISIGRRRTVVDSLPLG